MTILSEGEVFGNAAWSYIVRGGRHVNLLTFSTVNQSNVIFRTIPSEGIKVRENSFDEERRDSLVMIENSYPLPLNVNVYHHDKKRT